MNKINPTLQELANSCPVWLKDKDAFVQKARKDLANIIHRYRHEGRSNVLIRQSIFYNNLKYDIANPQEYFSSGW